ncbi:MAG: IS1595 family transposase [Caldilineaceae bacterium]|nr:IS1595 family transposase [Caldilineaceae bacterium]
MSVHDQKPQDVLSVFEFFEMLPDEQSAIEFIESVRWPDGVVCPRCKSARAKKIANQKRYNCNDCRRQFSVRTGTVFENTRIPLRKWLYALYMIQTARKGISSIQLSKELGITQKAAWFMLHRIREAMDPGLELLTGEVEVDEA